MKLTIMIDSNTIKALELFAGKADVRYYLNGINVEATDATTVRLSATNGHIAAIHRIAELHDYASEDAVFPFAGIVPRDAFQGVKGSVMLSIDTVTGRYSVNGGDRSGSLIDGKFPDIDRVIPKSVVLAPAHLNQEYVAAIGKAAKLMGMRYGATIFQNGTAASVFMVRDDFIGVIMPIRNAATEMPAWTGIRGIERMTRHKR